MLITRRHGSWVVLGPLVTDVEIESTPPLELDCGSCTLCIEACPTGALDEPGTLDSTRCLSYWTQAPAPIPDEYRAELGAQVYGCDICQDVCPWNRGIEKRRAGVQPPGDAEPHVSLVDWLAQDGPDLARRYDRLYVPRNDGRYLRRNAAVALGNTGRGDHRTLLEPYPDLDDENLRGARVAQTVGLEPRARLVRLVGEPGFPHPVEPEAPLGVARAVPRMNLPVWELALERVRLDEALRPGLLALLLVLDLDDPAVADRSAERRHELFLLGADMRLRGLRELELSEGLLELPPDTVEGRVGVGGDHRTDELEREPDRAGLQRGQPRGRTEVVAVQLLVDAHGVAVQLGVHRVAAAAEVDEVQELQVLFELLRRNAETLDELARGNRSEERRVGKECSIGA